MFTIPKKYQILQQKWFIKLRSYIICLLAPKITSVYIFIGLTFCRFGDGRWIENGSFEKDAIRELEVGKLCHFEYLKVHFLILFLSCWQDYPEDRRPHVQPRPREDVRDRLRGVPLRGQEQPRIRQGSSPDIRQERLKGTVSRDFDFWFFHESVSPKPLNIPLGPFQIFSKVREDIRSSRCTNLPPVSLIPVWCTLTCDYLCEFSKKKSKRS